MLFGFAEQGTPGRRLRRGVRCDARTPRSAPSPAGSASSPASSSCAVVAAGAARRPRPAGREPRRRPAATDHRRSRAASDGARRRAQPRRSRSCRRASCATARSSSRAASRSTSPAISRKRLGIPRVRFVYVKPASRLLVADGAALGPRRSPRSGPVRAASATADLSDPYLGTDQAVVLRRGLPRLTTLARPSPQDHVRACAGATAPGRSPASVRPLVQADPRAVGRRGCSSSSRPAPAMRRSSTRTPSGGSSPAAEACSARSRRGSSVGGGYVVAVTRGGPIAVVGGRPRPRADARRRHDAPARAAVARDRPGPPAAAALSRALLGRVAGHGRQGAPRERDPVVGAAPHVLAR